MPAIMMPTRPIDCKPESREEEMFYALENGLSADYYVLHSFHTNHINNNGILERHEIDFIIFHPQKGVLVLEAKSGRMRTNTNGEWYFVNSGEPVHYGKGPYAQAEDNMYTIRDYMKYHGHSELIKKTHFRYGVWLASYNDKDIQKLDKMPQGVIPEITLTSDALTTDIKERIDRIFEIPTKYNEPEMNFNAIETRAMVHDVLCPQFNIGSSISVENESRKTVFYRLLREQANVLNFLYEQKTAVINGAAGTGKTLVAAEKAKNEAEKGAKVLFLCYNAMLCEHLRTAHPKENVDYYTLAGLATKLCNKTKASMTELKDKLEDYYITGDFPYRHIVVDEGQDFGHRDDGTEDSEGIDLLNLLQRIIRDRDDDGTFFVFYDKLQRVQTKTIPTYIDDSDCKVTLYHNCRNTENIAVTSLKPINERKPKLVENAIPGDPTMLYYCKDYETARYQLNSAINSLRSNHVTDIVILTLKTEKSSFLRDYAVNGKYQNCLFTTYRKFKGLEADAVILIDVDADTFIKEDAMNFYVGASRARLHLDIISTLDNEDCRQILIEHFKMDEEDIGKKPMKTFAEEMDCAVIMSED